MILLCRLGDSEHTADLLWSARVSWKEELCLQ